jgi:hypothetical protein
VVHRPLPNNSTSVFVGDIILQIVILIHLLRAFIQADAGVTPWLASCTGVLGRSPGAQTRAHTYNPLAKGVPLLRLYRGPL